MVSELTKREASALGAADMTGPQLRARVLELEGALAEFGTWAKGFEYPQTGMGGGLHAEMWPSLTSSARKRMLGIVRSVLLDRGKEIES